VAAVIATLVTLLEGSEFTLRWVMLAARPAWQARWPTPYTCLQCASALWLSAAILSASFMLGVLFAVIFLVIK